MAIKIPKVPAYLDNEEVLRAWLQSFKAEVETGGFDLVNDTTPQLGGMLDVNGYTIGDGSRTILGFIEDASAVDYVVIENEEAGASKGPIIRSAGASSAPNLNLIAKGAGNVTIKDGVDETKKISFTLSAASTTTSTDLVFNQTADRIITFPDVTGTLLSTGAGITVAQLADGTAGELITWDASGNAATVATGTSGQVLTSNGPGAAPTFQTGGGGGGLTDVVDDLTPQLGGDLDTNDKDILIDSGRGIRDESDNEQINFTTTASAVNYLVVTNAATGSAPKINSAGSDGNVGLTIDTQGTGTLALGSADSVLTLNGTSISGALIKDEDDMASNSATHLCTQQSIKAYVDGAGSGLGNVVEDLTPQLGGDLDTNDKDILIDSGRGLRDESDNEQILFTTTASAVNYIEIVNAATGNSPQWKSNGSDTNVGFIIDTKGTGTLQLGTADSVVTIAGSVLNINEGVVVGSPTGGDKGTGTINAQAVYDDNTLLTCYVFDQFVDGHIDEAKWDAKTKAGSFHRPMRQFKARINTEYDPLDIDKYVQHFKDKKHLTSMPNEDRFNPKTGMPTGEWIQRLIETVEIQAIHISKLNDRLKEVERRL